MKDQRAPEDGVLVSGWRKVRKGGRVKFDKEYWTHDDLKPFVDKNVWVCFCDYWGTFVRVYQGEFQDLIVEIK